MKKLIGILVGLMILGGVAMAYTTQSTYETGTVATTSITVISLPETASSVLIMNDSSTSGEDIRVNLEGDLPIERITNEAFELKPGEWTIHDDFRTRRIHLVSDSGTPTYRIWTTY